MGAYIKFQEGKPDTADEVRQRITDIIDLADQDVLDVARSREVEQAVPDLLDVPNSIAEEHAP